MHSSRAFNWRLYPLPIIMWNPTSTFLPKGWEKLKVTICFVPVLNSRRWLQDVNGRSVVAGGEERRRDCVLPDICTAGQGSRTWSSDQENRSTWSRAVEGEAPRVRGKQAVRSLLYRQPFYRKISLISPLPPGYRPTSLATENSFRI